MQCTYSAHAVHMQCICRLPQAAASLGQSAARAALAGHTGLGLDTAAHRAGVSGSTHCEVEPCSCSRRSSAWAALSNACSGTCIGLRLRPTTRSSCQRGRTGSSELSSELGTSSMPVPMPDRSGARRTAGAVRTAVGRPGLAACCWANVSRAREGGDCGALSIPCHPHTHEHTHLETQNTQTHAHTQTVGPYMRSKPPLQSISTR